jgi:phosphoribosylglycinamide formyltransferase-1
LQAGVKLHGCTVHYVTPEVDGGPIIVQAAVPVLADDTPATLAARVLRQEHRIFPLAVGWIAAGRVHLRADGTVTVDGVPGPADAALVWPSP